MCYRSDLFKTSGLPTDRAEVSKLWPTCGAFIETGKTYVAGSGGGKKQFVDAATNIFNPVIAQQEFGYVDERDALQLDGGPKVAWETATKALDATISANLAALTPGWNARR